MQHIVSSMSSIAAIIKCFEKGKHEWMYSVNNVNVLKPVARETNTSVTPPDCRLFTMCTFTTHYLWNMEDCNV